MPPRKKEHAALLSKCLQDFEEDKVPHQRFCDDVEKRYRAFRGVLERRSEAASWTNKQHPAFVLQAVETMVANLVDPMPKWRIRAQPVMASVADVERLVRGARANEILLSHQVSMDKYAEKQRTFDLQALITGLTVSKQYWSRREFIKREWEQYDEPLIDVYGQVVGNVPRMREVEKPALARDDPTMDVIDVRDFIWHQGAISLQRAQRVTHRVWYSFSELQDLERQGIYGTEAGGESIQSLKETRDFGGELYSREQELFEVNRSKDQIEVLECWVEHGRRVVSIGNRNVLLADKPNPFWFDHLDYMYPFVVCSGMPDLFRIPGISEVELMMELQEMLWTLINQRLDNIQLINNAVVLIRSDVDDPDAFEFAPGERWLVDDPNQVKFLDVNPAVAEVSLSAEANVKGDMQNITGGMPFLAGTNSQTIDQQTATGVSIITSLAQKRLAGKKQQFIWAKSRIGEQWCAMNQQFVTTTRLVPVVGQDGATAFEEIRPDLISGSYVLDTEMVEESMLRSERRAEAQTKLQMFGQVAGIYATLGVPLNPRAFMDDYLDAFDISDKERYYSAEQPGQGLPQGGGPPGAQHALPVPPGAGSSSNGVTASSAAGPLSPSNADSMSPEASMQQFMAMRGTAN